MLMGGRGGYGAVARQVGRLLGGGSAAALGEDRLLARFALERDEAAFEALVSRHGPMVLGTCRRMLADPRDVEDAFQATFLVLARRAGSIRDADRLGPWLHGVARRVAARARALAARRAATERPGGEDRAVAPASSLEAAELRSALDEELARLPEKYRAPLVLCYLEGLTHDEAARHLRWPVGTVRSRLAGGRDRLRSRLTRRGLAPAPAALPALLADPSLPPALLTATARLATAAGTVPAQVAALAQGALIAMTMTQWKSIAALGLAAGLTAGGVGAIAQQSGQGPAAAKVEAPPKAGDPIADLRKEREAIENEMEVLNRRMEQVRYEQATELRPLGARLADLKAHAADLEHRWKVLVAKGGPAPAAPGAARPEAKADRPRDDRPTRAPEAEAAEPPASGALAKLQGEWKLVEARPTPGGNFRASMDIRWTVSGREVVTRVDGEEKDRERLTLGTRGAEATIDLVQVSAERGRGMTHRGLYKLEGGRLDVCLSMEDEERPGAFEAAVTGPNPFILTFQRQGATPKAPRPADDPPTELEAAHARIEKLEADLNAARAEPARRTPARARIPSGGGGGVAAWSRVGGDGTGKERARVTPLPGGECFLVIPPEADRMTLVNTGTGARSSFAVPEGVTEMNVCWTEGVGAVAFKGPEIGQVAAFDAEAGTWYPQTLREPAKELVAPDLGAGSAGYQVGRYIYMFSTASRKWGILELKQAPSAEEGRRMMGVQDGKAVVIEGDLFHLYNANTGDWTHLDTKEKEGK